MTRTVFRLILIVSCAHALVHVFEQSLPCVEQLIGDEFREGREWTGRLGTAWRIPFGAGALLAGWLADRFGSKRLLTIYLLGCMGTAVLASVAQTKTTVFLTMLTMGCFASIYHPAGLSLISRSTTAENRGQALGWHGIFGSTGIAGAPFLAALVFGAASITWRQYYLVLLVPAGAVVVLLHVWLREDHHAPQDRETPSTDVTDGDHAQWTHYGILVTSGVLAGLVYSSFMHFLPRYMDDANVFSGTSVAESARNMLAGVVFACGIAGQYIGGRLAKPHRLEWLLVAIFLGNAPLLLWMGVATGPTKVVAAGSLALVHFMSQPVYNSLIACYVPATRRSTGYGFSNTLCFGIGALGPWLAGLSGSNFAMYGGMAVVALLAGVAALFLRVGAKTR